MNGATKATVVIVAFIAAMALYLYLAALADVLVTNLWLPQWVSVIFEPAWWLWPTRVIVLWIEENLLPPIPVNNAVMNVAERFVRWRLTRSGVGLRSI